MIFFLPWAGTSLRCCASSLCRDLTLGCSATAAAAAASCAAGVCLHLLPIVRSRISSPTSHRRPSRYFDSIGLECVDLDGTLPVRENTQFLLNLPMLSSICYRHVHEGLSSAREQAPEQAAAAHASGPSA